MSPSFAVLFTLASLSTIYATPLALLPRSPRTVAEQGFGNTATGVSFDTQNVTCPTPGSGWGTVTTDSPNTDFTKLVSVRPDCDNVINSICNVVNFWYITNAPLSSIGSLAHTEGTCEGHFLITTGDDKARHYQNNVDYKTCVGKLQAIFGLCMAVEDGKGAVEGSQYGTVNTEYKTGTGIEAGWQRENYYPENQNTDPGYLLGPVGIFKGLQDDTDSSTIKVTIPA